jgi:hypothetical protein
MIKINFLFKFSINYDLNYTNFHFLYELNQFYMTKLIQLLDFI